MFHLIYSQTSTSLLHLVLQKPRLNKDGWLSSQTVGLLRGKSNQDTHQKELSCERNFRCSRWGEHRKSFPKLWLPEQGDMNIFYFRGKWICKREVSVLTPPRGGHSSHRCSPGHVYDTHYVLWYSGLSSFRDRDGSTKMKSRVAVGMALPAGSGLVLG